MNEKSEKTRVLGVMSGTSLDGLDLVLCRFFYSGHWQFSVEKCCTLPYPQYWKTRLKTAPALTGEQLTALDREYGDFIGYQINRFLEDVPFKPDLIGSHGHTVFHRPDLGFTLQIGHGANIAARTGIDTVCDLRSTDVALGGQGAPLVPMGDKLLFGGINGFLNLGGFANISFTLNGKQWAFDICPLNIVLNALAQKTGAEYDEGGKTARAGKVIPALLDELNALDFYAKPAPKSLGAEWVKENISPLVERFEKDHELPDLMNTLCRHMAFQINACVPGGIDKILVTGGGAYNAYLLDLLRENKEIDFSLPDAETIEFKEGLIFAFLGLLRKNEIVNIDREITGASRNSISGAFYKA